MNIKDFLNKIKNFGRKQTVYKRRIIYPDYDWICMVICSIFRVLFLGAVGLWVFSFVSSGSLWKVDSLPDIKEYKLNKKNLDIFQKYTKEKNEKSDNLKVNPENIQNPFL
jgi:hypothetical protein